MKFTIYYNSEYTEIAVRNLIHLNKLKESTNKLNIVDKDTLRKIRPRREKSHCNLENRNQKQTAKKNIGSNKSNRT